MKTIAVTIGTIVSFAWETVPGQRPTTGYKRWCDCTSHPDFNQERDAIETTTLCETNNHTYTQGLRDFGTMEFGANLTDDTIDMFIGNEGYYTLYPTKSAQGLRLWACVDIKGISKSQYCPVEPQDVGLPEGEAGSNKYEFLARFTAAGSAVLAEDPIYADDTYYDLTISGVATEGVTITVLKDSQIKRSYVTHSAEDEVLPIVAGKYQVIASKEGKDSQIKDVDLSSSKQTVTFTSFAD